MTTKVGQWDWRVQPVWVQCGSATPRNAKNNIQKETCISIASKQIYKTVIEARCYKILSEFRELKNLSREREWERDWTMRPMISRSPDSDGQGWAGWTRHWLLVGVIWNHQGVWLYDPWGNVWGRDTANIWGRKKETLNGSLVATLALVGSLMGGKYSTLNLFGAVWL